MSLIFSNCEKDEEMPNIELTCLIWSKTFGGFDLYHFKSVQQTTDGGYILAGWLTPFSDYNDDGWLVKIDKNGNVEE